jgi:hypothetical protein
VSAQVYQDLPSVDWREVIAGPDAVFLPGNGTERPGGRRELGLVKAIVIAAFIEILFGIVVSLILTWPHPHQHEQSRANSLQVHLVAAPPHAPHLATNGAKYRNPSAGRPGAQSKSGKAHTAGGSAGVAAAVTDSRGIEIARAVPGRRKDSGHIRLNADCASAQQGCLNVLALHRYLDRLHAILQQRLAALIKRDMPLGSGPVVLRFVVNPAGGEPGRVDVLDAPVGSNAGRQLGLALQGASLPPYPSGLGSRALSFKVALRPGGG